MATKTQWENENIFSYTGEGKINDMQFIRGNLALRNHITNGKRVFLFISLGNGRVRFEGELELITIDYFLGKDEKKNERTAMLRIFL